MARCSKLRLSGALGTKDAGTTQNDTGEMQRSGREWWVSSPL